MHNIKESNLKKEEKSETALSTGIFILEFVLKVYLKRYNTFISNEYFIFFCRWFILGCEQCTLQLEFSIGKTSIGQSASTKVYWRAAGSNWKPYTVYLL